MGVSTGNSDYALTLLRWKPLRPSILRKKGPASAVLQVTE